MDRASSGHSVRLDSESDNMLRRGMDQENEIRRPGQRIHICRD